VVKDSPANKAGLRRGDVVTEFNKKPVDNATMLRNLVSSAAPGNTADVKFVRDGKEQTVTVTLTEFKEKKAVKKMQYNNVLKGITVQEVNASIRDKLDLPATATGVVVTDIAQDSPVQGALQPNDVILEVNRKEITGLNDYDQVVSKIGENDNVLLLIYREGGTIYVTLRP
jgi:serine protease Do